VPGINFARRIFLFAGIYGILVLTPQYFIENKFARDFPPAITHPEHFYGFIGIALAWQFLFIIIGINPVRYRPAMIPAILEKLAFGLPCIVLYVQGRLALTIFGAAMIDLILAILFIMSFRVTPK
jgi:hypothetical protein